MGGEVAIGGRGRVGFADAPRRRASQAQARRATSRHLRLRQRRHRDVRRAARRSPDAIAGGAESGLDELQSVDVSPDGESVYVTSQEDNAIVHLERNPTTGALNFADCITGESGSGPSGPALAAAGPTTTPNGR